VKKSFSLTLSLLLLGVAALIVSCGDSTHPTASPAFSNQFAYIQAAGANGPVYMHEVKRVPRLGHRGQQLGLGLRPWANTMDSGPHSVYLMNNDGTSQVLVSDQSGWFESIQLSVNGKSAVFSAEATEIEGSTYNQIFLAKALSNNSFTVTQLTTDAEDHYQPQLSFDAAKVVFVKDIEGSQAYVMNATAGAAETLVPTPAGQIVYSPTFTPNGKSIVYEDCNPDSINIINLDGTGATVLHNADGSLEDDTPAVSPDGKLIAFAVYNNKMEDIYVMDITGQNVKQLTTDGLNDDPMFVNNKIVFISDRDDVGTSEIYSMDANGTNVKRLTNDALSQWFQTHDQNISY
jgi:Tol biopolymer transport system component